MLRGLVHEPHFIGTGNRQSNESLQAQEEMSFREPMQVPSVFSYSYIDNLIRV